MRSVTKTAGQKKLSGQLLIYTGILYAVPVTLQGYLSNPQVLFSCPANLPDSRITKRLFPFI
jgi:hypothetical protein